MKIISHSSDYYDFAGMGIDEAITFDRSKQSYDSFYDSFGLPERIEQVSDNMEMELIIAPAFVLVGGTGIPAMQISYVPRFETAYMKTFFDFSAGEEYIIGKSKNFDRFSFKKIKMALSEIQRHFERGRQDLSALCIKHRLIAGIVISDARYGRKKTKEDQIKSTFEPIYLSQVGLQDILPPEEAHMMIANFVGGVLTEPQDVEELSDTTKIIKAGFDTKQSFRTRKTKK